MLDNEEGFMDVELYDGDVGVTTNKDFRVVLKKVRSGRVAVVVLAGGQGTRLGYDGPKGTYPLFASLSSPADVKNTSTTTLYHLLAKIIVSLQLLAGDSLVVPLRLMISGEEGLDNNYGISNVLDIFLEEINELTVNEEEDLTKKEYRTLAAKNCLLKFYFFLNKKEGRDESLLYKLGGTGVQEFSINVNSLPVTAPIPKIGSRLQASGEAMYTQDYVSMTDPRFSLHGALVFANEVGKTIKAIDYTKARELAMVDFVDARDLKYDKKIMYDEVLFLAIGDVVPSVGYPVALVLFKNEKEGLNIAAAVDIKYGDKIEANMSPIFSLADIMRYNLVTLDEDKNPR